MPDTIYVTYTRTVFPEAWHMDIHYVRTDDIGTVTDHKVFEAGPQNFLSTFEKGLGVVEELMRDDNGPSRFGLIVGRIRDPIPGEEDYPREIIAEADDLSGNFNKMAQFV